MRNWEHTWGNYGGELEKRKLREGTVKQGKEVKEWVVREAKTWP
jgi:hypothetical protein